MQLSQTEENYLKALLGIAMHNSSEEVGTNELAAALEVKPATVNDMLKKLREKELVYYEKYGKITLTEIGKRHATHIIRKHRLWETFLFEKLEFTWDEVHEVAEQLEHIQSEKLFDKLDKFLGYPQFDPHGELIPSKTGDYGATYEDTLANMAVGDTCRMVAVRDDSPMFLKYVDQIGLALNDEITIISKQEYDDTTIIAVKGIHSSVSRKFTENIYVTQKRN